MAVISKASAKTVFSSGAKVSAGDFADLIDSYQDRNSALDTIVENVSAGVSGQLYVSDGAGALTAAGGVTLRDNLFEVSASADFSGRTNFTTVSASAIHSNGDAIVEGSAALRGNISVSGTFAGGATVYRTVSAATDASAGDSGKTIVVNTSVTATVNIQDGSDKPTGYNVRFIQRGAGVIQFAANAGVTINSKDSKLKSNGQFSQQLIDLYTAGTSAVYHLGGDLQ